MIRSMTRNLGLALAITAFTFLQIQEAHATPITYSDQATFLAATGASPTAPLPDLGLISGGAAASQTVGALTFTIAPPSSQLFIGLGGVNPGDTGAGTPWTTRLPGNQIAISDIENLNVDLASPVFSFGFDFVEPKLDPNINGPFADSTFQASLLHNLALVDSFTFNAPNDTAAFVGVWGDTQFNRVEIREIVGGLENEFFGQFYTGTAPIPVSTVPAPEVSGISYGIPHFGWVASFGGGLLGLAVIRRRHPRG